MVAWGWDAWKRAWSDPTFSGGRKHVPCAVNLFSKAFLCLCQHVYGMPALGVVLALARAHTLAGLCFLTHQTRRKGEWDRG